jgi:hypothetical protein
MGVQDIVLTQPVSPMGLCPTGKDPARLGCGGLQAARTQSVRGHMVLRLVRQVHVDQVASPLKQLPTLGAQVSQVQTLAGLLVFHRYCVDRLEGGLVVHARVVEIDDHRFGIISIQDERNSTKASKQQAAVIPESLPRPPDSTLISDWPIMAQPPMPPNSPQTMLATP